MDISLYDTVKLKDGRKAVIVEIYEPNKAYEADIETEDDYITDTISYEDIESVI